MHILVFPTCTFVRYTLTSIAISLIAACQTPQVTTTEETGQTSSSQTSSDPKEFIDGEERGAWHVNSLGKITFNGTLQPIRCANWHGLQGILPNEHENENDTLGSMELLVGNPWWIDSGRSMVQTLDELRDYGINTLRIPIAPETLEDKSSDTPLINHSSVAYSSARKNLDALILAANDRRMNIILSLYKCSNRVGWRAGTLEYDPGIDPGFGGIPDESCIDSSNPYNKERWLETLKKMAVLPTELHTNNIMAIDIYNEPWGYSWSQWKELAEAAYQAINSKNIGPLIFVQGIGQVGDPGKSIHGDDTTVPAWSENFFGFQSAVLNIPKNRLVLSPHIQGPSVFRAQQYFESRCQGLNENSAADAECEIQIDKDKLRTGWDEHFGFLRDQSYGLVIGEFGGNLNWPLNASPKDQTLWAHIAPGVEQIFQNELIDYMLERDIDGCYWAVNPEPSDNDFRGGLYVSPYQSQNNEADWGLWQHFDPIKKAMLKRLWQLEL